MAENKKIDDLDQYYTKPTISKKCTEILKSYFNEEFWENKIFLEPSAGTGSFITAVQEVFQNSFIIACDIEPKTPNISKMDFLKTSLNIEHLITIGNPPFGKRSATAIKFFNHATKFSDIVAFIVPI